MLVKAIQGSLAGQRTNNEVDLGTEREFELLVAHELVKLKLLNDTHLCNALRPKSSAMKDIERQKRECHVHLWSCLYS